MPVKGPRPFMDEALASLRLQGMGDDDLEIIVQDGDVEPDRGQSDALNKGFAKAHGEWLFWLNADDVLLSGALESVIAEIRRAQTSDPPVWITGNMMYLNADGSVMKCARERGWRWAYRGFPVRTYGPSSFFRRDLLGKAGKFDVACRYCMDTDMWCRFRAVGAWHTKINKYMWGFRIHDGSLTSGDLLGRTPDAMKRECELLDERHGLSRSASKIWRLQAIRILDGSYPLAYFDTLRYRAKSWRSAR